MKKMLIIAFPALAFLCLILLVISAHQYLEHRLARMKRFKIDTLIFQNHKENNLKLFVITRNDTLVQFFYYKQYKP